MVPQFKRHARIVQTVVQTNVRVITTRPANPAALGKWMSTRFHELGPTFVKIGQFISTRRDIFGDEFSDEFANMRDAVPPMPPAQVRAIVEQYAPCIAASIDLVPIASASIGQVHKVTLANGNVAVAKIKRPNIDTIIADDIAFLERLLAFAQLIGVERNIDLVKNGLRDFQAYLMQEVDFKKEAKSIARFRKIYAGADNVVIPALHKELCNDQIIVMEYVGSKCVTNMASISSGVVRRQLANDLMDIYISQLIQHGLIHGDPHLGNMGRDQEGRLVLYDFGNVIEVSLEERNHLKELIWQLLIGNNAGVVATLKKLGVGVTDESINAYIDLYREYMRTIDISTLAEKHDPTTKLPIQLTDKMFRIIRAYSILEGVCKQMYDEFSYYDVLDTYVDTLIMDPDFIDYKAKEDIRSFMSSSDATSVSSSSSKSKPSASQTVQPPQRFTVLMTWRDLAMLLMLAKTLL